MEHFERQEWTADTILAFLETHQQELKAMGVTKIGLFGSYVRGEQKPDSDIDLLLSVENWTWKRWNKVWDYLEEHLGVKVDLIPETDLRSELYPHVLPEVRYASGF